MARATLRRYWPWWILLAYMLIYEAVAITRRDLPTFSEMYWQGQDAWPALPWVVVPVVVVLLVHFVFRKWGH